jgi:hypothetical protein
MSEDIEPTLSKLDVVLTFSIEVSQYECKFDVCEDCQQKKYGRIVNLFTNEFISILSTQ